MSGIKKMWLYVIHGSEFEEESVWLFSKYLHGLSKFIQYPENDMVQI